MINKTNAAGVLFTATLATMAATAFAQTVVRQMPNFSAPDSNQQNSQVKADLSRGGMAIVPVMVNGKGPFRFGIDTGAQGYGRLAPATAVALGSESIGQIQVGDPSGRNTRTVPVHRLSELKLGETLFRNLEVTASMPPAMAERMGVDGILGIDLFKDFKLTLDYAGGAVMLDKVRLSADAPGTVRFTREDGLINIPVKVGGRDLKLHLDSGNSSAGLAVPEALAMSFTVKGEPRVVGQARTVSNSFDIKAVDIADKVTLGGVDLNVTSATFPSPGPIGNIGAHALQKLIVEIDQGASLLRVRKP